MLGVTLRLVCHIRRSTLDPAFGLDPQAQLRGALRGAAAPLSVPSLAKTLGLEPSVTGGGMLGTIVEELLAEGAVAGTLKGGGTSWTPAVYSRTQQDAVLNFYRCYLNPSRATTL